GEYDADSNVYLYAGDSSANRVDPNGLRTISIIADAFIPGRFGSWLPEPGNIWNDWEFRTDERTFGQRWEQSRVWSYGTIAPSNMGYIKPLKPQNGTAGSERRRKVNGVYEYYYKSTKVSGSSGATSVANYGPAKADITQITLDAAGNYPFV